MDGVEGASRDGVKAEPSANVAAGEAAQLCPAALQPGPFRPSPALHQAVPPVLTRRVVVASTSEPSTSSYGDPSSRAMCSTAPHAK